MNFRVDRNGTVLVFSRAAVLACGVAVLLLCASAQQAAAPEKPVGIFTGRTDIGADILPGSAEYDATNHTYTVAGGGDDIWIAPDAFDFVWRKLDANVTITADIAFVGDNGEMFHKAGFMIREGLDPNARYVDAMLHGSGLTSLQWRSDQGGPSDEIQAKDLNPHSIRLERKGDTFTMYVAGADGQFHEAATKDIALHGPLYLGLAVCSHDAKQLQKATFSNLQMTTATVVATP